MTQNNTKTDRHTKYHKGVLIDFPVKGGVTICAGTMVAVDHTGYALPAGNKVGYTFVGVSMEHADSATSADGAINVLVRTEGFFEFDAVNITQADVGKQMYVVDDRTFTPFCTSAGVKCGRLMKFVSSTRGWIKF